MKDWLNHFGLLWLRATTGAGLIFHGWMKLSTGADEFAGGALADNVLPLPLAFAWIAIAVELVGGFLMILGLWTRIAALFAAVVVGAAAFAGTNGDSWISCEKPLAYFVLTVAVILLGPGGYSVDGGKGPSRKAPKKEKK